MTAPTREQVRAERSAASRDPSRSAEHDARQARIDNALEIMRDRATEEASALDRFAETMAEHFGNPALTSSNSRALLQVAFREAQAVALLFAGRSPAPAASVPARTAGK